MQYRDLTIDSKKYTDTQCQLLVRITDHGPLNVTSPVTASLKRLNLVRVTRSGFYATDVGKTVAAKIKSALQSA